MPSFSATSLTSPHKSGASSSKKQLCLNLITAVIVAALVIGAFHKTVFAGAPISRVYQLGQRDTVFGKYFSTKREGYDASVYQYFVPYHVLTSRQMCQGILPLWNPLVGCGAPHLADVETAVFWPLRFLLSCVSPLRSWNLLIVANVLNFALGTYLLAMFLQLRRFAVIYASLICAFCPYLIFQSELIGSSASVIPYVMASFAYASSKRTILSVVLAGIASALMILSGHPEPSFFGIVCASMLFVCLSVLGVRMKDESSTSPPMPSQSISDTTGDDDSAKQNQWLLPAQRFLRSLGFIVVIGVVAFSFCSFMLLPFVELLKNSDCYKLGLDGHRFGVPLNSILINLVHPAYGNSSPYLGILAVPLALYSLVHLRTARTLQALWLCSIISVAVMSQLGPLDWLMNSKAFSWFVPKYCWPSFIVFFSLISACGLQYLITDLQKNWRRAAIVFVLCAVFALACLAFIRLSPAALECMRQDEAFEHMVVNGKYWVRDIICLTAFAVAVAASKFCGRAQAAICVLALAICSVISLAPVCKTASPLTAPFSYDEIEPIPFLQEHDGRILTMGRHVFCPSSNFCYGINNIVPVNVYHPGRFQRYLIECGITPEGVNQFFDGKLSPLIDLASVKYIVTPQPVLSTVEKVIPTAALKQNISWGGTQGVQLIEAGLQLRKDNRELIGRLLLHVRSDQASNLAIQPVLLDQNKNVLWLGDTERLMYLFSKSPHETELNLAKDISVPLPDSNSKMILAIQIFDWKKMNYLPSDLALIKGTRGDEANRLTIATCSLDKGELQSDLIAKMESSAPEQRFKLCYETASHLRVYENLQAMSHAYLSGDDFVFVQNENSALDLIKSPTFRSASKVVLETNEQSFRKQVASFESRYSSQEASAENESAVTRRIDCNHIEIAVNANSSRVLVLTENFYPGWRATIRQGSDIIEPEIMRANYLFQAIVVPPGKSTVVFSFCPAGFLVGQIILAVGLLLISGYAILNWRRRLKK